MRSVLDSPWYWLYLFSAVGLAALLIAGPRYRERQAQIESSGLRRQAAAMRVRGVNVEEPAARQGNSPADTTPPVISLQPLYLVLAVLILCGGLGLARQMSRRRLPPPPPSPSLPKATPP